MGLNSFESLFPLELTRAFPKFDMISLALGEELPKFLKDSYRVDLIWM